jgi:hypothetical protein
MLILLWVASRRFGQQRQFGPAHTAGPRTSRGTVLFPGRYVCATVNNNFYPAPYFVHELSGDDGI